MGEPKPNSGPLAGVRVIDMTTVIMGPYATQILADYGADVIKVEPPTGDIIRNGAPMRNPRMGAMFLQANRNKRSIALDVKKESARRLLMRLTARADVFVTNVRPAAMRRAGLGPEAVRATNPRLVHVSLVGYGENGPYAGRPAYDDLIQGITAMPWLYGHSYGQEPGFIPMTAADRIVGLNAVHVILAALLERDRSGEGQAVELSMFEAAAQFVLGDHLGGRAFEPAIADAGYRRVLTVDRRPYRTQDGYLCVLVYTDRNWKNFIEAVRDIEDLSADPRLVGHVTRSRNFNDISVVMARIFEQRTTAHWVAELQARDIPCVALNDLDALIDDPHLAAVDFFTAMEHPTEGAIRLTGIPSRWSRSQPAITRHPPGLGEHSIEIAREAGFSDEEITALTAEGALIDEGNRP
jgi:crotonobetainyl-CoA:carnitine CoA-transferase CaiB-like acyl-CoA transferase